MFIKSDILSSPHAFSTRRGGVSGLDHTKSLNLAFGRGDDDETVLENLSLFAGAVGFDPKSVVSLPQIHSDKVFTVTKESRGDGYFLRENIAEGDGYVTLERGVTLGIKTADCAPILFEAVRDGQVIAIGAAHAGWRGTVGKIAAKCADRLSKISGVDKSQILACIGPCIHKCCYEVSEDVVLAARSGVGAGLVDRFVVPNGHGKYQCDIAGLNRALLIECGLLPQNVQILDECTCCNPEKYFSHRYSGGVRGTMLSVIFMK